MGNQKSKTSEVHFFGRGLN